MGLISFLKNKFSKNKNIETQSYEEGLKKSRKNFANKLSKLSKRYSKVNEQYFEELESILIEADIGVNIVLETLDKLLIESKKKGIKDPESINDLLVDLLFKDYMDNGEVLTEIRFSSTTTVLLMVGVNGVGKTTTIAKIANRYLKMGKSVMLAAADTFRAGAYEQLSVWASRLNIELIGGKPNADPASVCYDAARIAKEKGIDLLIVDTAGRLQTKANLMAELAKIKRVLAKEIADAPQETFLVIDATTGQNGVLQAKSFSEVTDISGVVITKMDGTSKGGIILAIRSSLKIPVRFIGLGETMDDLKPFDLESYLYGLLVDNEDE